MVGDHIVFITCLNGNDSRSFFKDVTNLSINTLEGIDDMGTSKSEMTGARCNGVGRNAYNALLFCVLLEETAVRNL
jgi:hypothetical protein